jgi:hypothetical protein
MIAVCRVVTISNGGLNIGALAEARLLPQFA